MFRQFLCPSSGVFHCTHSNGICHTGLLTAFEQDQDGTAVPSWSCSQAVSKPVWHIALVCVQWITPDDGQRNYPKHVEFHSKNKFEKLVHLDGFIIRIYHDARSRERQKINILIKIFKNVARITQKINIFLINKLSVLHILFVNFIAGQLKFLIGRCNTVHGIYDWLFPCTCGHIVEF